MLDMSNVGFDSADSTKSFASRGLKFSERKIIRQDGRVLDYDRILEKNKRLEINNH